MTIARKYIRQCRTLFPVYGKSERTFLNRLKVQVNEHLDLFPDLSYEKLVEQFGTPKEVVMEYYANADDDYLLKRMNFVQTCSYLFICNRICTHRILCISFLRDLRIFSRN